MAATTIRVEGLRDLQRELRAVDKAWPKELRLANKDAAEIIVRQTRSNFGSRPGVAPKVVPSVKTLAQQRASYAKIGGNKHPYALGSEFGGGKFGKGNPTPRGGHTTQFPQFRKSGYALYPAIKSKRGEVMDQYGEAIDRLMRQAFPT